MKLLSARAVLHKLRELRLYLLIVALAFIATLTLDSLFSPLQANLQNLVFDQYQRWRPRQYDIDQPVRILDIDDESIRRIGPWPWPRQRMAAIVETLTGAKVAAISFDILFSEKDRSDADGARCAARSPTSVDQEKSCEGRADGDVLFARAIADRPVVFGSVLTMTENSASGEIPAKSGFAVAGDDPTPYLRGFHGALAPQPVLMKSVAGIGFMNWLPDADRVVRRVPLLLALNGKMQPSFAMESLRVAQGASTYVVRSTNASGDLAFGQSLGVTAVKVGDLVIFTQPSADVRAYFAKFDQRRSLPAWKLFDKGADLSDLAGKIVVVGVSATLVSDVVATPLSSSTPGVQAQAQLLEQILSGVVLLRPDWARGAELATSALLTLALVIAMPMAPVVWGALLGGLGAAAIACASWLAFARYDVLLDPITPSFSSGFVFLTGVVALYGQKRRQVNEIQSAFGRFVSPAVVARLAEHPENMRLGGQQRRLTLMFCDLRSFTTLSEGLSADELTRFLNEYLTPMTDAILKEMGTVDKYMGDAIMAFWNAPLDDPKHGVHAVHAALEMRRTLARLNAQWSTIKNHAIRNVKFGVGLNTGECCVGNLGSTLRFDYSAIGDEVNIASRLEGASKIFGVDIVASASTREEAPDFAWLEIDQVLLKNKTRPTSLFALVGDSSYAASAAFLEMAAQHASMMIAYRTRGFARAQDLAQRAAALAPEEVKGLFAYYQSRFDQLAASNLEPSWTPMIALEEK